MSDTVLWLAAALVTFALLAAIAASSAGRPTNDLQTGLTFVGLVLLFAFVVKALLFT